jgi:hypothetical protein
VGALLGLLQALDRPALGFAQRGERGLVFGFDLFRSDGHLTTPLLRSGFYITAKVAPGSLCG